MRQTEAKAAMVVVFVDLVKTPRTGKRTKPSPNKPGVVRLHYDARRPDAAWEVVSLEHRYPYMKKEDEARKVAAWLDEHKVKGVFRADSGLDKWRSFIVANGRVVYGSYHDTKEEAARAHDAMLLKVKGNIAWSMQNFPERVKPDVSMQNLLSSLHGHLDILHEGSWVRRKRKRDGYVVFQAQKNSRPLPDHKYSKRSQQEHHILVLRRLIAAYTLRREWPEAGAALLAFWKLLVARVEGYGTRMNAAPVGEWQTLVDMGTLILWEARGRAFVLRFLRSCLAYLEYYREHFDSNTKGSSESYYMEKLTRNEHHGLQPLREQIVVSVAMIQRLGRNNLATTQLEKHLRQDRYKRSSKLLCVTASNICSQALSDKKMSPNEKMDCYLKAMGLLKQALECDQGIEAGLCLIQLVDTLKTIKSKPVFRSLTQRSSQQSSQYSAANESEEEDADKEAMAAPLADSSEEIEAIVDKYCQDKLRDPCGWHAKVALVQTLPGRELSLVYDLREWQRSDPLNKKPIKELVQLCLRNSASTARDLVDGGSDASSFTGLQMLKCPSWSVVLNPRCCPDRPEAFVIYLWETLVRVMHKTKPGITKELFGQQWRKDLWRSRFFDNAEDGSIATLTTRQQKLLHSQYEAAYRILGSNDKVVIDLWKLIS